MVKMSCIKYFYQCFENQTQNSEENYQVEFCITRQTLVQIISITINFSPSFLNLIHLSTPDVSFVLKYAKQVVPSVALMSKFPILAPQKGSNSKGISTIEQSIWVHLSFYIFIFT